MIFSNHMGGRESFIQIHLTVGNLQWPISMYGFVFNLFIQFEEKLMDLNYIMFP